MALLVPAQFREHQATSLGDVPLQRLLDAAEVAIAARVGLLGTLTERRRGGGLFLYLSRRAGTLTTVTERYGDPLGVSSVVLDGTDYTLLPDGLTLRREWTGTHPANRWAEDVVVASTAFDDTSERQRVAIGLVKLDLTHNPGLASETIGDWSESYVNGSAMNYEMERESLLSSLDAGVAWFA